MDNWLYFSIFATLKKEYREKSEAINTSNKR